MDLARVLDGMARDTAWARARSAFRRMARQTGRSKARVIPWIARLAGGSTALRWARQRLFRLYVWPLVIMMGTNTERPSAFEATTSHYNPHVRWLVPQPDNQRGGYWQYYPKGQYRRGSVAGVG